MITVAPDSKAPTNLQLADEVLESAERHAKLLGLANWNIYIYWGLVEEYDVEDEVAAETATEPEYYKARIWFDLKVLETRSQHIDVCVRHELLHVVCWSFTSFVETLVYKNARAALEKLQERLVSDLERLPLWDVVYKCQKEK